MSYEELQELSQSFIKLKYEPYRRYFIRRTPMMVLSMEFRLASLFGYLGFCTEALLEYSKEYTSNHSKI